MRSIPNEIHFCQHHKILFSRNGTRPGQKETITNHPTFLLHGRDFSVPQRQAIYTVEGLSRFAMVTEHATSLFRALQCAFTTRKNITMSNLSLKVTSAGFMSQPTELHQLILFNIKPTDQWCLRFTNRYLYGLIEPPMRQHLQVLADFISRGQRRQAQFFFYAKFGRVRPAKAAQSYL